MGWGRPSGKNSHFFWVFLRGVSLTLLINDHSVDGERLIMIMTISSWILHTLSFKLLPQAKQSSMLHTHLDQVNANAPNHFYSQCLLSSLIQVGGANLWSHFTEKFKCSQFGEWLEQSNPPSESPTSSAAYLFVFLQISLIFRFLSLNFLIILMFSIFRI